MIHTSKVSCVVLNFKFFYLFSSTGKYTHLDVPVCIEENVLGLNVPVNDVVVVKVLRVEEGVGGTRKKTAKHGAG